MYIDLHTFIKDHLIIVYKKRESMINKAIILQPMDRVGEESESLDMFSNTAWRGERDAMLPAAPSTPSSSTNRPTQATMTGHVSSSGNSKDDTRTTICDSMVCRLLAAYTKDTTQFKPLMYSFLI